MKTLGNRLKITRIATLVSMVCVFTFQLFAPAVYADTTCASGISSIDCAAINNHWSDWVPDPCVNGGSTGGTPVSGSDNGQRIFNYFRNKGYSKEQAAGIVGNTQAESGSIPTRLQDGAMAGVRTISYSKIPANVLGEQIGWGIVQWTPPTKIGAYASTMNENPDSIDTQMEFLWKQLEGTAPNSNEKPAGDHVKATTNYTDATLAFMNYYERPANQSSAQTRITFAKAALAAYGGTSSGSSNTDSQGCGGGGAIGCGGSTDKYAALVGPSATFAGVDQGIDFTPANNTGYDICAPAAGTIVYVSTTDCIFARTKGCTQIREKLDQNPGVANSSLYIYYAEIIQVNSNITVGAHVNAGDVIGVNAKTPGIEVGWATGATGPWLCAPGIPTSCGTSFNNWILQLSTNLGKGGAGACTTAAPGSYGLIQQLLASKYKVNLQGNPDIGWAKETFNTICSLASAPTFYTKLTAQGTVPITLNAGACASAHGFTSASGGVELWGTCDAAYDRFIMGHELGHLFGFRNPTLHDQFVNGPWAVHHAWLPTWNCQIHSFDSSGAPLTSGPYQGSQPDECWADMIGEYLVYFSYRNTVGGAPVGSPNFKEYPTQYGDYYSFAKQLFGGVTYTAL